MSKIRSDFPQTPLNLTLREEQISIILCALENSVKYADSEYIEEVDEIFEVLEKTVDKYTRAGRYGKTIVCPECNKVATVYHFSWSALGCQECGAMAVSYTHLTLPTKRIV